MAGVEIGVSPPAAFLLSSASGALTAITPIAEAVRLTPSWPEAPGVTVRLPEPDMGEATAPNPPTRVSPPCSSGFPTVKLALSTSPTWTLPKLKLVWERVGVTRVSTGA